MNVANYEQRMAFSAHRQKVRVKRSPLAQRLKAIQETPAHVKAAVLVIVYFLAFGFMFQSSRAEFESKIAGYINTPNKTASQAGVTQTKNSVLATQKPTQKSPSPSPSATQQIGGLPGDTGMNDPGPSQAVQYTANGYAYGQCTFYVSRRRPIPQNWGNARDWVTRAKAAGFLTGKYARVGGIAQTTAGRYGHVAYVERIEDGKVYVSEYNYVGWNRLSYRWASESEFTYIY